MTVLLSPHIKYFFTEKKPPALFGATQHFSISCHDSSSSIWVIDWGGGLCLVYPCTHTIIFQRCSCRRGDWSFLKRGSLVVRQMLERWVRGRAGEKGRELKENVLMLMNGE